MDGCTCNTRYAQNKSHQLESDALLNFHSKAHAATLSHTAMRPKHQLTILFMTNSNHALLSNTNYKDRYQPASGGPDIYQPGSRRGACWLQLNKHNHEHLHCVAHHMRGICRSQQRLGHQLHRACATTRWLVSQHVSCSHGYSRDLAGHMATPHGITKSCLIKQVAPACQAAAAKRQGHCLEVPAEIGS